MLTVEDYGRIRRAYRDGMSIREISRRLHHSRRKVREALAEPQPRPYTRTEPVHCPVLGPFKPIIDLILKDDDTAPRKQRHTAAQIHRRLQTEHGYPGGYDQVRRYVASQHKRYRETFIPLSHDPGQRMEADFGHIYVDFPEGRRQVSVMLCTWAYSNTSMLLKTNLKQLRLPTISAEFAKLAHEAADGNEGYEQYLLRLTELEVAIRTANAMKSRIKQAHFSVMKEFDCYDFSLMPSLNKHKFLELTRGDWIDRRFNCCWIG